MKNNAAIFRGVILLLAAIAAGAVCAADAPPQIFNLTISKGSVPKEQSLIRVDKGAAVKLRISSDATGDLHLHPYKLEAHVEPGAPAEMAFIAHATGRFRFGWHPANVTETAGDKHGPPLATLEVLPK